MKKYTICGDIHCTPKNVHLVEQLFQQLESLGNDCILLGDILDTKSIVQGQCLNLYYKLLKQSKLNFIILVGNHDFFNLDCKDHSLQLLKELPNVTIVDKIMEIDGAVFFPYTHNREELKKELNSLPSGTTIFGHFDVSGCDYGNGRMCEDGLTLEDFNKFSIVISGHFHKYQNIGNFVYLGTPFSHSFGESNQTKYISILDGTSMEFIQTEFPRHITVTIGSNYNPTDPLEQTFDHIRTNDHLRVIYKGTKEEIGFLKSYFTTWPPGTKIKEEIQDSGINDIQIDEGVDNVSKFLQWGRGIKKLDEDTLALGKSILEAVNAK